MNQERINKERRRYEEEKLECERSLEEADKHIEAAMKCLETSIRMRKRAALFGFIGAICGVITILIHIFAA